MSYAITGASKAGSSAKLSNITNKVPSAIGGPKGGFSEDELSVDDSDYGDFLSFLKDEPMKKGVAVPGLTPTYSYDEMSTDDSEYGGFMAFLKAPSPGQGAVPESVPVADDSSTDDSDFAGFAAFLSAPSQRHVSPKEQLAQAKAAASKRRLSEVALKKQITAETAPMCESSESSMRSEAPPPQSQRRGKMDKKPSARVAPGAAVSKSINPASASSKDAITTDTSIAGSSDSSVVVHTHPDAPAAICYFTKKAEEDKLQNAIDSRQRALENMPAGTRYFDEKTRREKIAHDAAVQEMIEAPRPAAVEYFTLKALQEEEERKRAIAEGADAPAAYAIQHFTDKAREEKERQAAEIKAMRENPQANTVAGQHFDKINAQKKREYEELMNQPSSVATEYFNKKAEEEKRMFEEAKSRSQTHEVSAATQHFQKLEEDKRRQIEAAKASSKAKGTVEPLPVDYFTKLNDAEMEAKAKAQWEAAEAQISLGQAYFTAKGEEDKVLALEEQRKLSEENMSEATRHFHRIAAEKEASAKEKQTEQMPLAIQHFTLADREIKDKKRAEIEGMKENPPDMPPGQAYFTNQANAEREKREAEIKAMRENPQANTVAGQHFDKINAQKKKEYEDLMNQPASVATEYFNKKAEEEKQRMSRSSGATHEKCAATLHFENLSAKKARDIEEARSRTRAKEPMKPVPIDYFTKLGQAETEARAQKTKERAEAVMPSATKYFTDAAMAEATAKVSEEHMSTATVHFSRRAEAEKQKAASTEMMPLGIQYFTMKAHEERQEKQKALENLKDSPYQMPPGQAHFTQELSK